MQFTNKKSKVILVGHPRCGGQYLAAVFKAYRHQLPFDEWGADGITSWRIAAEKHHPQPYIQYIRNPLQAIPSILLNDNPNWYDYRNKALQQKYQLNLDDYSTINAAAISFLFWNRMIKDHQPVKTIKIEDGVQPLLEYTRTAFGWQYTNPANLQQSDYNRGITSLEVNWNELRKDLLTALDEWCQEYGYQPLSKNIDYRHKLQAASNDKLSQLLLQQPKRRSVQRVLGPRARNTPQPAGGSVGPAAIEPSTNIRPRLVHNVIVQSQQGAELTQRERQRRGVFSIRK